MPYFIIVDNKYVYKASDPYKWCDKKRSTGLNNCSIEDPLIPFPLWEDDPPGPPYEALDPTWGDLEFAVDDPYYDFEGEWVVVQAIVWTWHLEDWEMYDCYWDEPADNYKKSWHLFYEKVTRAELEFVGENVGGIIPCLAAIKLLSGIAGQFSIKVPGFFEGGKQ